MTTTLEPLAPAQHAVETSNEDQLVIVVAERHVRTGVRGDSRASATALALKEAGHSNVSVCTADIRIGRRAYDVPDSLSA